MTTHIYIDIPGNITDDEGLKEYLLDQHEAWEAALDMSANLKDDRSVVDEFDITEIEFDGDDVIVQYDVQVSAYHGCKDLNYANIDPRSIMARKVGSQVVFEVFVYPPPRTTYEEF